MAIIQSCGINFEDKSSKLEKINCQKSFKGRFVELRRTLLTKVARKIANLLALLIEHLIEMRNRLELLI